VNKYKIDYNAEMAVLYSTTGLQDALDRFVSLAEQCFGIRKCIFYPLRVLNCEEEVDLPEYWRQHPEAREMLVTNIGYGGYGTPDVIVFGEDGAKVKSEWDDVGPDRWDVEDEAKAFSNPDSVLSTKK
jgi:hypothetical protein